MPFWPSLSKTGKQFVKIISDEDLSWSEEMGTDKRPIQATNHLILICQCHYVGDLRRNSTPNNPNSKHDFGGCFYLS